MLPEGNIRLVFFIIVSAAYYIGYTCQCVVTKSAQSCVTNDPKQRPLFAAFDGVYNTLLFAGNIVIPMTADCADYETYRSGKYVPGLMGTLFSFVDKIVSSFAPMIAGLVFAEDGRDPGQGFCHQGCFRQLIYTLSADPSPPFS